MSQPNRMKKLLQKLRIKDRETLEGLTLISQLGLNIVVSLLIFFLIFLWLDRKLQTNNILLFAGIILGIACGIYLNYKHLKRFYDKKP